MKDQRAETRGQFLRKSAALMVASYIALDALDTWLKSVHVNTVLSAPVTGDLPLWQQMMCAVISCASPHIGMEMEFTIIATFFTAIGFTRPVSWPPMFDQPLMAESIADFWGNRWHYLFRQTFRSLTSAISPSFPTSTHPKQLVLRRIIDALLAFFLSAILHLIVMYRIPVNALHPHPDFWDMSNFWFYFAQPIGIALETLLVLTFTPRSNPKNVNSPTQGPPKHTVIH